MSAVTSFRTFIFSKDNLICRLAQHRTALLATLQCNISPLYKSYVMFIGYSLRHTLMSLCADEPPSLAFQPLRVVAWRSVEQSWSQDSGNSI